VTKTPDASPVDAGTSIGFTIKVANASTSGTGTAKSVSLSDSLPGGTDVSWSIDVQPSGSTCTISGNPPTQTLSCANLGDLAAGASKSVHVASSTTRFSCQSYANTATASAGNNPSTGGSATIVVQCPKLSITKTAVAGTVDAGSQIGFDITVSNASDPGTGTAKSVTLSDPLPGGSGVSWTITLQPSGTPCSITSTASGQSLSCAFGDLTAGTSKTVHLRSSTDDTSCQSYANTASASGTNLATISDSATITVECPDLSVTKTADSATVAGGSAMGFTIKVANASTAGTGTAKSVTLSDPLPGGTNVSWSIDTQPSGNPCSISGNPPAQTLSCPSLGDLAPGASVTIHITSATTTGSCASYANTATASASNNPSVTGSATIDVGCASMTVHKTADHATVISGAQIGFTITVGNGGPQAAINAKLADSLPGGPSISWTITSQPATKPCAISGNVPTQTLSCAFGSFATTDSAVIHLTSPTSDASCATYSNTAKATADNSPPAMSTDTVAVQCRTATLYTGSQQVIPGSSITLSARITGATLCTSGGSVSFSLDRNPQAPAANPFPIVVSVSGGMATAPALSTTGWAAGIYTVTAAYAGPANCLPSSDTATLAAGTIPASAQSRSVGDYVLDAMVNRFQFSLLKRSGGTLSGQLILNAASGWNLTGNITTLILTDGTTGTAGGTGMLSLGSVPMGTVPFTFSFHANTRPYTFGVRISMTPLPSQPPLPNTPPVALYQGIIALFSA
jgi:uncharacterized repeat protein (TIGR01451 family)